MSMKFFLPKSFQFDVVDWFSVVWITECLIGFNCTGEKTLFSALLIEICCARHASLNVPLLHSLRLISFGLAHVNSLTFDSTDNFYNLGDNFSEWHSRAKLLYVLMDCRTKLNISLHQRLAHSLYNNFGWILIFPLTIHGGMAAWWIKQKHISMKHSSQLILDVHKIKALAESKAVPRLLNFYSAP